MSRIWSLARLAILAAAMGVAVARQTADVRVVPVLLDLMTGPGWPPDDVTRLDRDWAGLAAREHFGRGPVGYVGEYPTAYEVEWWYYVACYALAPTVVVPGRAADRVIVDRPTGLTVVAGEPR